MSELQGRDTSIGRREALGRLAVLGSAPLLGCSGSDDEETSAANLGGLSLSTGTLSPSFSGSVTTYTVSVSNATSSVTITPTVGTAGATVRVNGTVVPSGTPSSAITLNLGTNSIAIVVSAPDGTTTKTYTVVVTRANVSGVSCVIIPQETEGPFPLLPYLANSAVRRQDIRESKTGVPLTLALTLVNVNASCAPIANAAIYIWHCDKDGAYSGYSGNGNGNHAGETYLRGVQTTDANGTVSFVTVYPGWYAGRITHIHAEVFLQNNLGATAKATTQFAFPQAITQAVYSSPLYSARGQNTSVASFSADNVFVDGSEFQLLSITGSVAAGYTGTITIGVAL